jgi:hypothetical protein
LSYKEKLNQKSETKYPPTSPTAEIMDPEDIKLLQAIKAMAIKPKTDSPQDFAPTNDIFIVALFGTI